MTRIGIALTLLSLAPLALAQSGEAVTSSWAPLLVAASLACATAMGRRRAA